MLEWADRAGLVGAVFGCARAPFARDAAGAGARGPAGGGTHQCSRSARIRRRRRRSRSRAQAPLLVDPYIAARSSARRRRRCGFFRTMTTWHRWLALEGDEPRRRQGRHRRREPRVPVHRPQRHLPVAAEALEPGSSSRTCSGSAAGLSAKARDFNWHNVIGIWSAIPLAIVVAGAVPISYPWASNLVYRIVGETPPRPPAAASTGGAASAAALRVVTVTSRGVDAAWAAAQAQIPGWRTMTTRLAHQRRRAGSHHASTKATAASRRSAPRSRCRSRDRRGREGRKFQSLSAGRRLRIVAALRAHRRDLRADRPDRRRPRVGRRGGARLHGHCARVPTFPRLACAWPRRRADASSRLNGAIMRRMARGHFFALSLLLLVFAPAAPRRSRRRRRPRKTTTPATSCSRPTPRSSGSSTK